MGDKKYEKKPQAFPRTSPPTRGPAAKRPEVSLGKSERITSPAKPDAPFLALTGRYERDDQGATMQVNQAGQALVCWFVDYKTKALTKFEGTQDGSQSFVLNVEFSSNNAGRLSQVLAGELILDVGGSTQLFRKVGPGPTLSDFALAMAPPQAKLLARRQEHFPLSSSDRQRIRKALDKSVVAPMIDAVQDAPNDSDVAARLKRGQLAEVIDNHVRALFSSIHPDDHPLAEELAQQVLLAQSHTRDGDKRTLLDWLQTITTRSEAERLGPTGEMEHLERHLKLTKTGTGTHFYKFVLTVIGPSGDFGVGLGGFLGTLEVTEVDKARTSTLRSVGTFTLVMGQASLGPSVGVSIGFTDSGDATSPYVWRAVNIPGSFRIIDAGGGFSTPIPMPDGVDGNSVSTTAMFLSGNGEFPQLVIDFSGFSTSFGIAAGAALSGSLGYIFSSATPPPAFPGKHKTEQNYTTSHNAQDKVHFKFGSSVLTDEARQILRILCANELASFASPGSGLTISSHADRVDTEERNLELSDLRSKNTLQVFKDILDKDMMPDKRVTLRGLGEQGAAEAGDKDHTQNPARRKSEVVINSRLVVTLFGKR